MTFTDISELKLRVLGTDAIKTFETLNASAKDVKDQLKEMELAGKKNTEEYRALGRVQRDIQDEIKKTTQGIDIQNASMKELEALMKRKVMELKKLTVGSDEWMSKLKEIEPIRVKMDEANTAIRNIGKSTDDATKNTSLLGNAWNRVKDVAAGALAALSLDRLLDATIDFIRTGIKGAAELSDAFAKVQKTTGMTKAEVEGMNDAIKKLDTRTLQSDLLKIGEVGGQIGVAKDEMLGFVEATDKAVVALGDEFSGGAEEVTKKLGPLKILFKETKDLEFGDAVNKIGSALNELGAAGTATAPVVADFAARMGQLGDLSPQISQVMGLGASFQELGLTAEISSGGVANILLGAAKATELFAKQVGLTEAAFKDLINTNPNEVLLKLAESFRGMPTDKVVKQLDDLGIKSQEATKVMSLLKDQTALVREKQELANRAMAEGTSLTKEFNIVNNTEAAQLEKAQKALENKRVELGQRLLPTYIAITKAGTAFTGFLAENSAMIIKAGAFIATYAGFQKLQVMWTERQVLLEGLKATAAKVSLVLQGQQILINQAQTGSMNILTAAETRAVTAATAFNNVMQRNAIILAVTVAMAGLVKLYQDYSDAVDIANSMSLDHIKKTDESIMAERKHGAELKINIERTKNLAYGTEERKLEVEKIMKIYPQYFKNMTAEQVSNWHLEQAYKGVNSELQRKIELMAREKRVSAMTDRAASIKAELEGLGVYASTLTEYNKTAKESFADGFKDIRGKLLEYETIMGKMSSAQKDLSNANINNFNAEARSAAVRYKAGTISLQQYRDEVTAIQDKHKIFVANYTKEVAVHTGGTGIIIGNTEKRSKAEKKAAEDTQKSIRENEKLAVELWEKSFEKEMELAGMALEEKKDKARAEITNEKELNTRLIVLTEQYWQEKTAIEAKYTQLAASYQTIQRTNTLEQLKVIPMQSIKLEEWKADRTKSLNDLVEKQKKEYWDAEAKRIEDNKKLLEKQVQMGIQAIDSLMQKTDEYLNKVISTSDDANKRMAASLGKEFLKPMQENLNAAKALLSGDIVGAAEGLFGYFQGIWKTTIGIKETLRGIKEEEFWTMFESGFERVNKYADQIKNTFDTLISDTETFQDGMGNKAGIEGVIEAQIKLGDQIKTNYATAVEKENTYSETVKKNIEDAHSLEVKRINDKYDLLSQKATAQYSADTLASQTSTNQSLLAFITNEDSKTSLAAEYSSKRAFIEATYADQIRPITEGMSQAEVNGILAATKARDEAFAKVEEWRTKEIESILSNEDQKRTIYTDTDKILIAGKEEIERIGIAFAAAELKRSTDRNAELLAATNTFNKDIEGENKRHQDEIVRLGQEKDAALLASFNALKEAMKTGYSEILSAAHEAYRQGIISAGEYEAAVQRVLKLKNMLGDGNTLAERINDRIKDFTMPGYVSGPDGLTSGTEGFALGTEYVDHQNKYPQGTDTVPAYLNKGERVISAPDNAQLRGISNKDIVGMVMRSNLYRNGPHISTSSGSMVNLANPASVHHATNVMQQFSTTALEGGMGALAKELQVQSKLLEIIASKDPSINFHALKQAFQDDADITARASF